MLHLAEPPAALLGADAADSGARPREMSHTEAESLLRAEHWGLLATVDGDQPYAVPVSFGYDGSSVYLACAPGRKVDNIKANPRVCLTVTRIHDSERWRTVVIEGEALPVQSLAGRAAALRLIQRQRSGPMMVSLQDARRAAAALVFQIVPSTITGRTRG